MKKVVVALGGNALVDPKKSMKLTLQREHAKQVVEEIVYLVKSGYGVIVTHGNGPQVGEILLRSDKAKKVAYELPLDVCVAQSQGEIGYWLGQEIKNALKKARINKDVVTILTQVVVDKKDPAFKKPTKPIGPFYKKSPGKGYVYDSGRGYRKVVASPIPKRLLEDEVIQHMARRDCIVIASGGGGIPVVKGRSGYEGVEAVIDKDYTAALLGKCVKAEILLIVTSIPFVYLRFGSKKQEALKKLSIKDAKKYLKDSEFALGSMAPKIRACIHFLQNGGKRAIITDRKHIKKAFEGKAGTIITK